MGWKQLLALGSLVASIVACGGGTAAGPPEPIQ
jgi:hypothetical protein